MNIAKKLLEIDKGKFNEKQTEEMTSEMLSKLLGEKTKITIQSINPQEVLDISTLGTDENGNQIMGKTLEVASLLAASAVIDPPLKDEKLLEHLEVTTPADAALKLFKGEVNVIAARVNKMAGFREDAAETDKEIKN